MQENLKPLVYNEVLWFVTMVLPHVVLLVTSILTFIQSRENKRGIGRIETTLNGKVKDKEETK